MHHPLRLIGALIFGCLCPLQASAQEQANNIRFGVSRQAIFVSGDFPPPVGTLVVRMAETSGRLTSLHLISEQGTVVVPPPLIEGLVASTNVELVWFTGLDEKMHASIQIPCKDWADKQPAFQFCKKAFILVGGQLRAMISHVPVEGGTAITYKDLP